MAICIPQRQEELSCCLAKVLFNICLNVVCAMSVDLLKEHLSHNNQQFFAMVNYKRDDCLGPPLHKWPLS